MSYDRMMLGHDGRTSLRVAMRQRPREPLWPRRIPLIFEALATRSRSQGRASAAARMGTAANPRTLWWHGGARMAWRTECASRETKERAAFSPIVSFLGSCECRFSGEAMDMGGEQGSRSMCILSRKELCAAIQFAPLHRGTQAFMRGRLAVNANATAFHPATLPEAA